MIGKACAMALSRGRGVTRAVALLAGLALSPAWADTAPPTATTATYGNWIIGCNMVQQADGTGQAQVCQMTTRLNIKGKDGKVSPLLAIMIGTPPGAKVARLMVQLPTDVALREPVTLSVDKPGSTADADQAKPQDDLADLKYLTCTPQGCAADTDADADLVAKLKAVKTINVTFSAFASTRKIIVPVSLDGFSDGIAALGANTK